MANQPPRLRSGIMYRFHPYQVPTTNYGRAEYSSEDVEQWATALHFHHSSFRQEAKHLAVDLSQACTDILQRGVSDNMSRARAQAMQVKADEFLRRLNRNEGWMAQEKQQAINTGMPHAYMAVSAKHKAKIEINYLHRVIQADQAYLASGGPGVIGVNTGLPGPRGPQGPQGPKGRRGRRGCPGRDFTDPRGPGGGNDENPGDDGGNGGNGGNGGGGGHDEGNDNANDDVNDGGNDDVNDDANDDEDDDGGNDGGIDEGSGDDRDDRDDGGNGGNGVSGGGNTTSKPNGKATPKAKGSTTATRLTRSATKNDTRNNPQGPNKRRRLVGHFSSESDVDFLPRLPKGNQKQSSSSVLRGSSVPAMDTQDLDLMIQNAMLSDQPDFNMFDGCQSVPTTMVGKL
ncbi:hypothetical protein CGCSCA4_v014135 [Colletotrichum siamense]|uniref:Uncharacterized protein n=1 Tax=Colletotrichum siamense TaxID=690259 RepID=A0A9P5BNA7_COLSI|nr:hypothetical protein CGCSCA4_v014135 [Colletotrichum siamense]KAF4846104.1 hypothetical protein CGCSCA2_v013314 [Colletotrichum siamense]